jgi:hypothetical protein
MPEAGPPSEDGTGGDTPSRAGLMASLVEAWARAAGALPAHWRLLGVVQVELVPDRILDEVVLDGETLVLDWLAIARDAEFRHTIGLGAQPEQALLDLANQLLQAQPDHAG